MQLKPSNKIKLSDTVFDARFHPTSPNNLIAAATIAGDVHIIESGCLKDKIRKHHKGSSIRKVRFFNDGRMVTIAKTTKVYDLQTNQTLITLKRDDGKPTTFYSVKPFGANIVSAGDDDGGVFVWDLRTPEEPIFSSYDCEQYISDIDGKFETRKLMVCTSGEGTLTAYDLRAKKMIEPQSELFEAGFQCLKLVDSLKKIVIGGEDGSIYVFNHNEWAHTSGKFAIDNDVHNRGKCSIDCIDVLPDNNIFLAGCSDGRLRSVSLWPHKIISETTLCKRASIESIHVNPNENCDEIVVGGGNYVNIVEYQEKSDDEEESDAEGVEATTPSSAVSTLSDDSSTPSSESDHTEKSNKSANKKLKTGLPKNNKDDDDYLKIFS